MNCKPLFDFHSYLAACIDANRLAQQHGFHFCTCSGIGHLEEMVAGLRQYKAFACVSDVTEDALVQRGGAWFKRRVFTVFLVRRYDTRFMTAYRDAMGVCRELQRQLHTRFLRDEQELRNRLAYIDVSEIRSRELGGQFLNAATGLYFMLAMDEPADLRYDSEEWTTGFSIT